MQKGNLRKWRGESHLTIMQSDFSTTDTEKKNLTLNFTLG